MTQFDNTNRGQFWKNDKKETDRHPDWKGSINVEGVEYWLSAWNRKPDANPKAPSVSISIQRKEQQPDAGFQQQQAPQQSQQAVPPATDDLNDAIPFNSPYKRREYLL